MKKTGIWLLIGVMVMFALLPAITGCTTSTPTSKPATSASPAPAAQPSPTAVPTTKPTSAPSPTPAAKPSVIKWNMQAVYPMNNYYTILFGLEWAAWVKDITSGRLQVDVHPPGTFAKGTDVLPAVSKGLVHSSLDYGSYYSSDIPVTKVESGLPMAWSGYEDTYDAYYNRGILDLLRQAYASKYNVIQLGMVVQRNPYNLGTVWRFKNLDEVKGKKIRATGVYADYITALGGKTVVIDSADQYMAFKTGICDGMIAGAGGLKSMKYAEVLKSWIIEPSLTPLVICAPSINKTAWDALPEDIRHILMEQTKYFQAIACQKYRILNVMDLAWAKGQGVDLVTLSSEDVARATKASIAIWDTVAKEDSYSAKAVDIVKKQLKDWGRLP